MRGREKIQQGVKRGQTIVAERERAESDSERMQARKQLRRKRMRAVVSACLMLAILGLLAYSGAKELVGLGKPETEVVEEKKVTAEIVDESGRGQISARMREYIIQLEEDFRALGYTVTKVILPVNTSRELYIDLAGETTYFKVSMDRGAAVTAEDAERMLRYLRERELTPEYVDVRIEGKAYYK